MRPRPVPGAGSSSRKRWSAGSRKGSGPSELAESRGRSAPGVGMARSAQTAVGEVEIGLGDRPRLLGEARGSYPAAALPRKSSAWTRITPSRRPLVGEEGQDLDELELVVEVMLEPQLDPLEVAMGPHDRVARGEVRRDLAGVDAESGRRERRTRRREHASSGPPTIGPSWSTSRHGRIGRPSRPRRRRSAALSPLVMMRSAMRRLPWPVRARVLSIPPLPPRRRLG